MPTQQTPAVTTAPTTTTSAPASETASTSSAPQQKAPVGEWSPTENPQATIVPGQMRSDREEIPEPFTKADADKAETMEARISTARLTAGCQVYWPSPFEVCGVIRDKYNSLGGPGGFLSFPTTAELTNPGNTGKRTQFINGPIYWSAATGAHPVVNSFLNRWGLNGYEAGRLHYPTTDEIVLPDGGRRQEFQDGVIYVAFQNAVGSALVNGPLRDKYNALGGLTPGGSFLGYPTEDQKGLPDGQGQMDRFQNGVIYSHPTHGAHAVSGTILQDWAGAGYETSTYGYPTGDPVQTTDIWYEQQFQNGTLAGTIVINRDLYWPLVSPSTSPSVAARQDDDPPIPGENYESDVLPCVEYDPDFDGEEPLAAFKVRGISTIIYVCCERFRQHMATNPYINGNSGHFSNYPPTRDDWYNFLSCTFHTFNAETYHDVDPGNFGRQRGNTSTGVNSVSIGNASNGSFVTGWAGDNTSSSKWAGCVAGLAKPWA